MIQEVKNAVTKRLNDMFGPGCRVYTESVEQGLKEPCFFVEMFPTAFTLDNTEVERQSIGVRLAYVPEKYGQDELIRVALTVKKGFLYRPIAIEGRAVQTYNIQFDIADDVLIAVMTYDVFVTPERERGSFEAATKLDFDVKEGG